MKQLALLVLGIIAFGVSQAQARYYVVVPAHGVPWTYAYVNTSSVENDDFTLYYNNEPAAAAAFNTFINAWRQKQPY